MNIKRSIIVTEAHSPARENQPIRVVKVVMSQVLTVM